MEVEINNLSEPVEPVPMNELSIARYVEPVGDKLRKMDGMEWLDSALAEEQEACEEANRKTIFPPTGPDDYPDYGDWEGL